MPEAWDSLEHVQLVAAMIEAYVLHARDTTGKLKLFFRQRMMKAPFASKSLQRVQLTNPDFGPDRILRVVWPFGCPHSVPRRLGVS